jgi:hypothetical protein
MDIVVQYPNIHQYPNIFLMLHHIKTTPQSRTEQQIHLTAVANPNPFFLNALCIRFFYLIKQVDVVNVGQINAKTRRFRQVHDAFIALVEIGFDVRFDEVFLFIVEVAEVNPREINAAPFVEIAFHIAQEIYLLEGRTQGTRRFFKSLVLSVIPLSKNAQTHQPNHFRRAVNVLLV